MREIYGVMRCHPEQKEVPITPYNSLFFQEIGPDGKPTMVYQGTGLVASMLEAMDGCRKITGEDAACSFFDATVGNFYNNAILRKLVVAKNGNTKHTAYLEVDGQEVIMPAGNIYCLGGVAISEETVLEQMQKTAAEPILVNA